MHMTSAEAKRIVDGSIEHRDSTSMRSFLKLQFVHVCEKSGSVSLRPESGVESLDNPAELQESVGCKKAQFL